jgi:translation elongation factor EF-1alpha
MEEQKIGVVTHYFGHIKVAAIKIEDDILKAGDTVHFKGYTTDFKQKIKSMQIDHVEISEAKPGDDLAVKVKKHVREHDEVYKVIE